jgi:hypothetical protein
MSRWKMLSMYILRNGIELFFIFQQVCEFQNVPATAGKRKLCDVSILAVWKYN